MRIGYRIQPEDVWNALTVLFYVEIIATLILIVIGVRWLVLRRKSNNTNRIKDE